MLLAVARHEGDVAEGEDGGDDPHHVLHLAVGEAEHLELVQRVRPLGDVVDPVDLRGAGEGRGVSRERGGARARSAAAAAAVAGGGDGRVLQ